MLFTPMMLPEMIAIDMSIVNKGYSSNQFFIDIFSALGDWAITEPFETKERSFDETLVKSSKFYGGVNLKPKKIKIFGYPFFNDYRLPSIYDVSLDLGNSNLSFLDHLKHSFNISRGAKSSGLFLDEDFLMAKNEINSENLNLSHGLRKTTHIIMADAVIKIVENSGKKNNTYF